MAPSNGPTEACRQHRRPLLGPCVKVLLDTGRGRFEYLKGILRTVVLLLQVVIVTSPIMTTLKNGRLQHAMPDESRVVRRAAYIFNDFDNRYFAV